MTSSRRRRLTPELEALYAERYGPPVRCPNAHQSDADPDLPLAIAELRKSRRRLLAGLPSDPKDPE